MRYYIENVALNFDLCDAVRHFQLVVPQRAAVCPILLNAIYAVSARHLSRLSTFDELVSNKYQQQCIEHLIPMLSDDAAVMDENLLAAMVILRYLEEVEVPLSGADTQSHLLGTHIFLQAQESHTMTGGLRQAAYWVALRQEIYIAFVSQRSIVPTLEHCAVERSLEPGDDCAWANRIIVHCAHVIKYCFGDASKTTLLYDSLVEYCERWMAFKPPSFDPMFLREPTSSDGDGGGKDKIFPEIWLLNDAVVTALQHYHLAKILLSAHNPKLPRLGPSSRPALKIVDEDIKFHVRTICGMALSNARTPPCFV